MLKYVWLPEYRTSEAPLRNTLGWWEKYIVREVEPQNARIGSYNTVSSEA
jgi:hypothetical protein